MRVRFMLLDDYNFRRAKDRESHGHIVLPICLLVLPVSRVKTTWKLYVKYATQSSQISQ